MNKILLASAISISMCFSAQAQKTSLAPYCDNGYDLGASFGNDIQNVTMGNLNNSSNGLYQNSNIVFYDNLTPEPISKGVATSIDVTVFHGDAELNTVDVFIDLNNDNQFTANEKVGGVPTGDVIKSAFGQNVTFTFNITIPATATVTGDTRMRVIYADGNPDHNGDFSRTKEIDPCYNAQNPTQGHDGFNYGETEDYIVTVGAGTPNPNSIKNVRSNTTIALYPNPANDYVNITLDNTFDKEHMVQLFNALGTVVMNKTVTHNNASFQLDVSSLPSGIYKILVVDEAHRTNTARLVKL